METPARWGRCVNLRRGCTLRQAGADRSAIARAAEDDTASTLSAMRAAGALLAAETRKAQHALPWAVSFRLLARAPFVGACVLNIEIEGHCEEARSLSLGERIVRELSPMRALIFPPASSVCLPT